MFRTILIHHHDGPIRSETCRNFSVFNNIILKLITVVRICWLKLQKLHYNARNGKYKTLIKHMLFPRTLVTHLFE
jgi:hypothetical protein